jgi:hypothetical protein
MSIKQNKTTSANRPPLLRRGLGRGVIFSLIALFSSCTEDVDLSVVSGEKKIVIEGSIENGKPAKVIITHSSPVSQAIDINAILVTNAKVYVFDGTTTDTLTFGIDSSASFPLLYSGSSVIGIPNQTYHLTVVADGKTYTATTTIPQPIALDSVWWKAQPPSDTLGFAWAHLSDPPGMGNAYRWYAKRPQDRRYLAPRGATFDDKFVDGKSFDFAFDRGTDPTDPQAEDHDAADFGYYRKGQTVYIKFCTTDYTTARFYTTYEAAMSTNGNPFASPVTIISNINGGALGIWGGFGCTYDTIN